MSETDSADLRRIPSFMLRGFWDEVERRGVSRAELEAESGVSRPAGGDFVSWVSPDEMHRVFVAGQALCKDERIGLSAGRAMGASSLHLVGHLVFASPTLARAIELVARVQPHFGQRLPKLQPIAGGRSRFGVPLEERSEISPGARIESELTAVLLYDVGRMFLDERHGSPAVQFPFATPADRRAFQQVFAGEVEFGCDGTWCVFPSTALRRRAGVDGGLVRHLSSLARDHYDAARTEHDWSARVRAALRAHHAPRLLEPNQLAEQLQLSPRALARRLTREGTSVSRLTDQVLFERARSALRRPGTTAAQVAEELGYAELSSFFRAFRRWSGGLTPKAYRERDAE